MKDGDDDPGRTGDDCVSLREVIGDICGQLRRGNLPTVDTNGLPDSDSMMLQELAEVSARPMRMNANYSAALELMRDAFAAFGPDLRINYCNQSFRNVFLPTTRVDVGVHFKALIDTIERYGLASVEGDVLGVGSG